MSNEATRKLGIPIINARPCRLWLIRNWLAVTGLNGNVQITRYNDTWSITGGTKGLFGLFTPKSPDLKII
jgi:hypothetical protein